MIAIRCQDVGKRYHVYRRPADRLKELLWPGRRSWHRDVWALENLYLEIPAGSTWGIIGPNGAGKSTLLKIVTGTTRATTGQVEIAGSVSGLLELGQGFDPEFSGRSNVLMNCSILGMTRAEALERFESIVEFAELWDVIDRPVRTYSTGMYLRLAFSVATSVDPDILVVDEALAVGDEYFRGKCYDRINDFRKLGRTVLFVSHALGVVRNLCDQVVLLHEGRAIATGLPDEVADTYLKLVHEQADARLRGLNLRSEQHEPPRWGSGAIEMREVRCLGPDGKERYSFTPGGGLTIEARYRVKEDVERPVFGVGIFRTDGTYICGMNHLWHERPLDLGPVRGGETGRVRCTIEPLPLLQGTYYISYYCYDHGTTVPRPVDHREKVKVFEVTEGPHEIHGTVALPARWEVDR